MSCTPAERRVIGLLCEGYGHSEIAQKLGVGYDYVKTLLCRIYRKFDVSGADALCAVLLLPLDSPLRAGIRRRGQ